MNEHIPMIPANTRRPGRWPLALGLTALLVLPTPTDAQTPGRVQVRLSGTGFNAPVVADYLGGLATRLEFPPDDAGEIRDPIPMPATLRFTAVTLRRTRVDDELKQWRAAVDRGEGFARDVLLEFVRPDLQTVARFRLSAAWPSKYAIAGSLAATTPGANPRTVSVESVTLVFDNFVREP